MNTDDDAAVALGAQIVEFIQAAGGASTSDSLVTYFGRALQPSQMPLFKQLLRQVAKLQPAATGSGKVWVLLKPQDQGGA